MRLLVVGGTSFVGRTFVEAALAAEHQVTTFNRGRAGADVPGVEVVRGDRESVSDLAHLSTQGPWDAVFDPSGHVPDVVAATVRALGDRFGRYVFVSTVGAYLRWPEEPVTEQSQLWPDDSEEDHLGNASAAAVDRAAVVAYRTRHLGGGCRSRRTGGAGLPAADEDSRSDLAVDDRRWRGRRRALEGERDRPSPGAVAGEHMASPHALVSDHPPAVKAAGPLDALSVLNASIC